MSPTPATPRPIPRRVSLADSYGFIHEDGLSFAGRHLLIDCFDCAASPSCDEIDAMMVRACVATGATVLFHHVHPFAGGGSSGAVILAESHGTHHWWPEQNFVAVDIFVCGACDPHKAVAIIAALFQPQRVACKLERRGLLA